MKISVNEFLKMTQVLRMLYGIQVAQAFFEANLENFGFSMQDLRTRINNATLDSTND